MGPVIDRHASGSGEVVQKSRRFSGRPGERQSEAQTIVVQALTTHAPALLKTARRHSLCADDAHDAYQRAVEILLRRADTLDPARALNWLHTVVKHEAMAVRRSRQELVGGVDQDPDRHPASGDESPEERALSWEHTARAAEALQRLKPQELRALWLKASGLSYAEIAEQESWTYTKVNRCLAEGRKSFLERYAGIESGAECERWAPLLSALVDGEATAAQVAEVRPHLRNCAACRATVRQLHEAGPSLSVLFPAPVVGALTGGPGHGPGILNRLWDLLGGVVGDRATALAVKAQLAGDSVTGAKAAVVAVSAVAAAGGGAAAVHESRHRTEAQPLSRPASASPGVAQSLKTNAAHLRGADRRKSRKNAKRSQGTSEFDAPSGRADSTQVDEEFGPERTAGASASPKPSTKSRSSSVHTGAEFDP